MQHALDLATRSVNKKAHMYGAAIYLQMIILFEPGFDGGFDGWNTAVSFAGSYSSFHRACLPSVVTLASPKSILVPGM
jgi:hypothetical protein